MKKLLFIGINYHTYTKAIIREFGLLGYEVTFHDIERWTTGRKILRALSPARFKAMRDREHKAILAATRDACFDVVFFLQVHQFSLENLRALKASQPKARFILYNWDSIAALTHMGFDYRPHLMLFDQAFTFDRRDAGDLGIGYLPLFCVREFQGRPAVSAERGGVYFVGNLENVRRYRAVHAFRNYCQEHDILLSVFMACRLRMLLRLFAAHIRPKGIRFGSIPREEFLHMLDGATAVFDFANHDQSGFTMRVMENLCAGKKIITNNTGILKEDFYTNDRIFVFKGLDFTGVKDFIAQPITSSGTVFERFYIQNFANHLLSPPVSA